MDVYIKAQTIKQDTLSRGLIQHIDVFNPFYFSCFEKAVN